jgi:hypothetical protein
MDEVTQQNAALVEEAAAAAESMREQAKGLYAAVSVFKLDKAGSAPTAVVKPAIAPSAETTPASLRDERRLPGHLKERRPVKVKEEKDGEWKEF